jgi:hypothetical protein
MAGALLSGLQPITDFFQKSSLNILTQTPPDDNYANSMVETINQDLVHAVDVALACLLLIGGYNVPLAPCTRGKLIVQVEDIMLTPDPMFNSPKADDVLLQRKHNGPIPEAIDFPVMQATSQHFFTGCQIGLWRQLRAAGAGQEPV